MTYILPKAAAFGRAMIMLSKPSLSCRPQTQDEPPGKVKARKACDLQGVGCLLDSYRSSKISLSNFTKKKPLYEQPHHYSYLMLLIACRTFE